MIPPGAHDADGVFERAQVTTASRTLLHRRGEVEDLVDAVVAAFGDHVGGAYSRPRSVPVLVPAHQDDAFGRRAAWLIARPEPDAPSR